MQSKRIPLDSRPLFTSATLLSAVTLRLHYKLLFFLGGFKTSLCTRRTEVTSRFKMTIILLSTDQFVELCFSDVAQSLRKWSSTSTTSTVSE